MEHNLNDDTIFAPATVPGTGAISVIRISGPEAIRAAASVIRPAVRTDLAPNHTIQSSARPSSASIRQDTAPGMTTDCHTRPTAPTSCPESGPATSGMSFTWDGHNCGTDIKDDINLAIMYSKGYRIHFGRIYGADGTLLDEVLANVFRAPHSYTGEDSVEISCHASSYIVSEISALLVKAGLRPAAPGEFTQRAFLNGKMDLAQAEAVADVIAAQSAAAHRVAISQLKGGFSSELKDMRGSLLEIVSLMELELDFSDEDVEFADRSRLDSLVDGVLAHIHRLMDSFRLGNAIKNGVPVALVGATNVGKSTLLNALLGEDRAIVSDVHGTTRDTVEETMNIDGVLFRFIDTAGLRETAEVVERIGIERSYRKLRDARIVLGIVDATRPLEEIKSGISGILSRTDPAVQTVFVVVNKCDAARAEDTTILQGREEVKSYETYCKSSNQFSKNCTSAESGELYNKNVLTINKIVSFIDDKDISVIPISAKEKSGIDALKSALAASQKDILGNSDAVLVTNTRHFEALSSAAGALERVRAGLASGVPTDLISQDLREALYHLSSILGEISTDEILGNIFRNFCIGK